MLWHKNAENLTVCTAMSGGVSSFLMAHQHILGYLVPMTTEVSTDYIMPSTVTSKLTDCTTSEKHIYNHVKVFSMVLVSI